MKYFLNGLSNYANFKGRAGRKEYWYFYLFWVIFSYLAEGIDYILFGYNPYAAWDNEPFYTEHSVFPIFSMIFMFGTLVPFLAFSWRRMHDIGKNGWYSLIPIYGWPILMCRNGDSGENDYGSDPKISSE